MSRPSFFAWTRTGNYPVGGDPWASQPLGLQPAGTWFTPNTKPAAEEFNWLLGTLTDQTAALLSYSTSAILNWRAPQGGSVTSGISNTGFTMDTTNAVAWDAFENRWLVIGRDITTGSADQVSAMQSTDGMATWVSTMTNYHTTNSTTRRFCPLALYVSPTTGMPMMALRQDNGTYCHLFKNVTNVWSSTFSLTGDTTQVRFENNGTLYLALAGSATTPLIVSSPDGSTWTSRTIPAAVTSAPTWATCTNGTRTFAFPGTAGLTKFAYSDDGITWSAGTIGIAGGDTIVSAAVVQQLSGPVIVVCAHNGGGHDFWNSLDNGGTWTKVRSGLQGSGYSSWTISDMAVNGSMLVAAGQGGPLTLAWSPDAGTTWYQIMTGIPTNGPGTGGYAENTTTPRLAASPSGFMWMNSLWLSMSFEQGPSGIAI